MLDVFVKYQDVFADKFSVQGYEIMSKDAWRHIQLSLLDIEHQLEHRICAIETIVYDSGQDLLEHLTWCYISNDDAVTLTTLLGTEFGNMPSLSDYI